VRNYTPKPYLGQIDMFVTADHWHKSHLWQPFAANMQEHYLRQFKVNDLLLGPHVDLLARALQERLDQIRTGNLATTAPATC
jgi:hypothetical protein